MGWGVVSRGECKRMDRVESRRRRVSGQRDNVDKG